MSTYRSIVNPALKNPRQLELNAVNADKSWDRRKIAWPKTVLASVVLLMRLKFLAVDAKS